MIVDDNRDSADSLSELLRLLGCETTVFYDANEALGALRYFAPTIALVDLSMPVMDGHQFAQRIRVDYRDSDLRLVALTGLSQPENMSHSMAAGFDDHIVKPISIQQLSDLLGSRP